MYSYIRGTIEEINEDSIVIDNHGIGYEVMVPTSVLPNLKMQGGEVKLFTYFHTSENGIGLYGFSDQEMRQMFRLLIGVNGIGPKAAIAILSTLTVADLRFAIAGEDAKAISKAPGIGPKIAQRAILELKGKIDFEEAFESKLNAAAVASVDTDLRQNVVMALSALGYSSSEALKAMQEVAISEDMSEELLLKETLKRLTFL